MACWEALSKATLTGNKSLNVGFNSPELSSCFKSVTISSSMEQSSRNSRLFILAPSLRQHAVWLENSFMVFLMVEWCKP
jgi:hypothetical protein